MKLDNTTSVVNTYKGDKRTQSVYSYATFISLKTATHFISPFEASLSPTTLQTRLL